MGESNANYPKKRRNTASSVTPAKRPSTERMLIDGLPIDAWTSLQGKGNDKEEIRGRSEGEV
jgi:hypothetical protein